MAHFAFRTVAVHRPGPPAAPSVCPRRPRRGATVLPRGARLSPSSHHAALPGAAAVTARSLTLGPWFSVGVSWER